MPSSSVSFILFVILTAKMEILEFSFNLPAGMMGLIPRFDRPSVITRITFRVFSLAPALALKISCVRTNSSALPVVVRPFVYLVAKKEN